MTITASIVADSVGLNHKSRLTSVQMRYPRFIHAELMTHRMFSRSASSSRAIPVERLIKDVINDTAMPIHWGANQKGMQADNECEAEVDYFGATLGRGAAWIEARNNAIEWAEAFSEAGYHKQIVNRLLEPFSHINVIVTATEWGNFFALRDHKDAQPEIRELAQQVKKAMEGGAIRTLTQEEWHLPYVTDQERLELSEMDAAMVSAARCARVSYLTHDGATPSIEKDLELFERLVGSEPEHASPLEHVAQAEFYAENFYNLTGFRSLRWTRDHA